MKTTQKVFVSVCLPDGSLLDRIEMEVSADSFTTILAVNEMTPEVGEIHMLTLGKV